MNELLLLTPALLTGLLLGAFFFGGLWWTVRHCVSSKWVALCFLASLLLRSALLMLGFYYVVGAEWQRMLVALSGFIIARFIVTRLTRPAQMAASLSQETSHAP